METKDQKLTLEEFKNWLSEIKSNKRDDKMDFVWAIMKSPYVEYHYNLLKDDTLETSFVEDLGMTFDEHGEKGALFLLDKLNKKEDLDFQGNIIFLLGRLSKYNKNETRKHARELSKSKNDYIRENAIIVLNWVGGAKEYSILKDRLLNDINIKCRAWAASAFMQMWFTRKSKKLRSFALTLFKEALEKERNYFVLATIIESIREIENKKFSITQKSLENLNEIEIDKAKTRLLKYLTKNAVINSELR